MSTRQRPSVLKHGSDRHETLPKRVLHYPHQFNFRHVFGEICRSQKSFYAFLAQFRRIYGETDLNGDFLAIFRSRCTYYELCTIKNRRKCVRRRSGVCPVPPLSGTPPLRLVYNMHGSNFSNCLFYRPENEFIHVVRHLLQLG